MNLMAIAEQFQDRFVAKYAKQLLPGHLNALHAILRCRTPDSGELHVRCTECGRAEWRPLSCGHRSCPQCQNHEASQWLVLQHVLPRGFRRVRDYGFLHGNAKKLLKLVQLILHVMLEASPPRKRPVFKCPCCKALMAITAFRRPRLLSG